MNEIKKEFPEGKRQIEMVLVKMLRETRSWDDFMQIGDALWNIRRHAESKQKEQEQFLGLNNVALPKQRINENNPSP